MVAILEMRINIPGNYPKECWNVEEKKRNCLSFGKKAFMLIDIHNYSRFCLNMSGKPDIVSAFIRNFFFRVEGNLGELARNVCVNKYIGDAIFCSFPLEITLPLVNACQDLLSDFVIENDQISKQTGLKLSLCIILDTCNCLVGGVRSNLYFDYSYWGNDVNQLFGLTKRKETREGYIWIGRDLLSSLPEEKRKELIMSHLFVPKEVQCEDRIKNYWGTLVES